MMDTQPCRQGAWRTDLMAIAATILMASIFPVNLFPNQVQEVPGINGQFSGKQGDTLFIRIVDQGRISRATGRFLSRQVTFFPDGTGGVASLLGLDLQDPPGTHELSVELLAEEGPRQLSYNVLVLKEKFPAQHLTLPKDQVDLDAATLARATAEREEAREVLSRLSAHRYWENAFIEPVDGRITGAFGGRRIINGQARSPHNGEDIAAPPGTEVRAMNDGVVGRTVEHFFSGKGVFLDHGLGLHSMYFHLSEVVVQEGQVVSRGQIIGKVGATGRASGPHLHWGVRVNGARVNPYSLLKLPLPIDVTARP